MFSDFFIIIIIRFLSLTFLFNKVEFATSKPGLLLFIYDEFSLRLLFAIALFIFAPSKKDNELYLLANMISFSFCGTP